jgi:hypothetical protein
MIPFPLTAAEIDAVAAKTEGSADYHLSSPFWKEARTDGLLPEKAEAFRLLGSVLGLPFRPSDATHPFGDARTNKSFENLTVELANELEKLAPAIQSAQIRARLADVAWTRKRGNPASARLAVSAYIVSARALENPRKWTECANRIERAATLSRSLGAEDETFSSVSSYMLEIAERYRGNDPLFLTGKIIELLFEFGIGNPDSYVEYLSNAAGHARDANEFHRWRYYLDVLAKLHGYRKDAEARNATLRELAQTFETEAEQRERQGENLAAVHFLNQAIQAHRRVPDCASYVEALRPKLQRVERASVAEFKKISGPLDIGEKTIAARKHVTGVSMRWPYPLAKDWR